MKDIKKEYLLGRMKALKKKENTDGFTLLEIIVSLILVGILATVIVGFFGTNFTMSLKMVEESRKMAGLKSAIENVNAQYRQAIRFNKFDQIAVANTNGFTLTIKPTNSKISLGDSADLDLLQVDFVEGGQTYFKMFFPFVDG